MGFWADLANGLQQVSMEKEIERGMPGGRHLLRAIQQNGYDRQQMAQTHAAYDHAVDDAHATREWAAAVEDAAQRDVNDAQGHIYAMQEELNRVWHQLRCAEEAIAERDEVIEGLEERVEELEQQERDSRNPLCADYRCKPVYAEQEVEEDTIAAEAWPYAEQSVDDVADEEVDEDPADAIARLRAEVAALQADR